jgi:hypothetical protein
MGTNNVAKVFRSIESGVKRAHIRAINRAGKSAFSATSKFIRDTYNIKKEDLDKFAKFTNATLRRPMGQLIVNRKAIPLIKFGAKFPKVKKGKARGVHATIKKGNRQVWKNAFIASMPTGHRGVFIRKTEKYLPIKELWGPSGMDLFGSEIAQKQLEEKYLERYEIELAAQIDYYVNKKK